MQKLPQMMRVIGIVAATTGLRISEVLSLKGMDIDWKGFALPEKPHAITFGDASLLLSHLQPFCNEHSSTKQTVSSLGLISPSKAASRK